jgi:coproporphyrinogen III oxidase-like Fe-S oxidoreductase
MDGERRRSRHARGTGTAGRVRLDPPIDLQRLRASGPAVLLRRAAFRAIVGRGWPPTLQPVTEGERLPRLAARDLYVHLPFCATRCPHCPYTTTFDSPELRAVYAAALVRELDAYFAGGDAPPVDSLYFGGGTPSRTPELVELVIELVQPWLSDETEIGVECHPSDATAANLALLRMSGVTRISLGIETLRPDLLRLLGRPYTPLQALAGIRRARAAGFDCVDVNLIFAIPGQSAEDAVADVERCLELGVDQVSAYPLFTFPYTPLGRRIADGTVRPVGDRTRLASQRGIARACRRHGLVRSSVWSFTRPGVAPYSTVTHDCYVGFGVGAGSKVDGELRFNSFSFEAYVAADPPRPALRLALGERFERAHWIYWQAYRTRLDPAAYARRFGRDLGADAGRWLAVLRLLRLARPCPDGCWRLTERGSVWVHRLQALFSLAYIDQLWGLARGEPWPGPVALR